MENQHPTPSEHLPFCVDLDGTLIHTDLTFESLLSVLKRAPWVLFLLPLWLLKGKSHLKDRLARQTQLDTSVLPYNPAVVELTRAARSAGRPTVLVTGSHEQLALRIAEDLSLFDSVLATQAGSNLIGANKARRLDELFGQGRYEYVANARVDLAVWRSASAAITVNAPPSVVREVAAMGKPHQDLPGTGNTLRIWLRAIRIQQWVKNSLLFIPILTAHEVLNLEAVFAAIIAFICFGTLASATYIVNDLLDLDADRHHHKKKKRPFAAGTLSVQWGLASMVGLMLASLLLAMALPLGFQLSLVAYLVTTLLYSLALKRVASLDVLLLAGLYTLRIVAGAFATGIALSFWLLAFSMFVFLSLALVKRVAELVEVHKRETAASAPLGKLRGREYGTEDIAILQSLGASSGYLSVLVLALYIHSEEVFTLYQGPEFLWLIAPLLLLWVTRLWIVTARGYMDEDPIFYAVKDPETWATGVAVVLIMLAATFVPI
jgi:4-hydroxybenzoate polyprenyltransferase/phosphoserine phosphatase